MTRLNDLHEKWMKEPAYKQAYDALEEEFALASALLKARDIAHVTQEDVAKPARPLWSALTRNRPRMEGRRRTC